VAAALAQTDSLQRSQIKGGMPDGVPLAGFQIGTSTRAGAANNDLARLSPGLGWAKYHSTRASEAERVSGGQMKTKTLQQMIMFKASPRDLYEMIMDSRKQREGEDQSESRR